MLQHTRKPFGIRDGFTLLELVVVMGILATLAGLLIPLMPYLVEKASTASTATNLNEVSKAVQTFAARDRASRYPDQLDSIVDATGAIATYVPNGELSTAGAPLATDTLGDADFAALTAAGIVNVAQMKTTSSNPTFSPYASTWLTPLSATSKVAILSGAVAKQKFGLPASGRYVVFGLGNYATMAGKTMNKPPVASIPTTGYGPNQKYCRFGLVFRTTDMNGTAMPRAKFVGAVQLTGYGVMTQDDKLSDYYKLTQQ